MDADLTSLFMNFLQQQQVDPMTTKAGYVDANYNTGPQYKSTPTTVDPNGFYGQMPSTGATDSVSKGAATSSSGGFSQAGVQSATGWSSLANSFISNAMHKKYADLLMQQKLTIPRSLYEAESIQRNQATQGLPGYDNMRQGLFDSLAEVTNKANETGQSSSVLKTLADSYSNVENTLNSLQITNADAKMKNQLALMGFLSSVKSPYEQRIQEFEISKRLAAEQERMQGKKDLMEGATSLVTNESGAVGSILDMVMGG
jgi:hypothetical protein